MTQTETQPDFFAVQTGAQATAAPALQELPMNWEWATVETIVDTISTNDKKIQRSEYLENGNLPVIDQGQNFISGYTNLKDSRIQVDSPVIIFGDHTRAFKFVSFDFAPGADGIKVLRPLLVDPHWFFRFAQALELPNRGYSRHFQFLRTADIPIPPLLEQKRIVAKLEELLSELEFGVKTLKIALAKVKKYRQSVLKAAVQGDLSKAWREAQGDSLEPASVLLKKVLLERQQKWVLEQQAKGRKNAKYTEPQAPDSSGLAELPEGWVWASVEQLGFVQLGRQRSPKNISKDYPTKYIRAANITEKGLALTDILEMEFRPQELETFRMQYGDIVLSEASGSPEQVGKPAMWENQISDCCFQNTVIRLRPVRVDSKFILYVFKQFYASKKFMQASAGVGINHLSAGKFSHIDFPLPPLEEQAFIVSQVEAKLSATDHLENSIKANLLRAERLRASTLNMAFRGELVPQDATDEPAAVLLERIRGLRAEAGRKKLPKKSSSP